MLVIAAENGLARAPRGAQPNSARRASHAVEQTGGDGLLVETLVRQAVEPMLRDWLDVHLQGIVERLVRREVERIARRAELG